eukprot:15338409-Ditylum_brightwellii.AAC.1
MLLMQFHSDGSSVAPCPIPKTTALRLCQFLKAKMPNAVVMLYLMLYSIANRKHPMTYGSPALIFVRSKTRGVIQL